MSTADSFWRMYREAPDNQDRGRVVAQMQEVNIAHRIELILGEFSEVNRDDARALIQRFAKEDQVAVAEFLIDADTVRKYYDAKLRVIEFLPPKGLTARDLFDIYRSLGLRSRGAERS
jgi:hypothetical protein